MLNNALADFKFHTKNYIHVNKKPQKHARNMYTIKIHSHTDHTVKNLQTVKMCFSRRNISMYNRVEVWQEGVVINLLQKNFKIHNYMQMTCTCTIACT